MIGFGGEYGFQLAYLFPWPVQLVCSQGMLAGIGDQDSGMVGVGEEDG